MKATIAATRCWYTLTMKSAAVGIEAGDRDRVGLGLRHGHLVGGFGDPPWVRSYGRPRAWVGQTVGSGGADVGGGVDELRAGAGEGQIGRSGCAGRHHRRPPRPHAGRSGRRGAQGGRSGPGRRCAGGRRRRPGRCAGTPTHVHVVATSLPVTSREDAEVALGDLGHGRLLRRCRKRPGGAGAARWRWARRPRWRRRRRRSRRAPAAAATTHRGCSRRSGGCTGARRWPPAPPQGRRPCGPGRVAEALAQQPRRRPGPLAVIPWHSTTATRARTGPSAGRRRPRGRGGVGRRPARGSSRGRAERTTAAAPAAATAHRSIRNIGHPAASIPPDRRMRVDRSPPAANGASWRAPARGGRQAAAGTSGPRSSPPTAPPPSSSSTGW